MIFITRSLLTEIRRKMIGDYYEVDGEEGLQLILTKLESLSRAVGSIPRLFSRYDGAFILVNDDCVPCKNDDDKPEIALLGGLKISKAFQPMRD